MKKLRPCIVLIAILITAAVVVAQSQLASWPSFVEITTNQSAGVYQFTVPLEVMGQSRDDLGDLRLFDSENHEVPYAIRTRTSINEQREFDGRVFNEVTIGSTATEATIDLGENREEHNEARIQTEGENFRRRVTIEGSDSRSEWRTLVTDAVIFNFQSEGKTAASERVTYPTSRYRYLRVRVSRDELSDKAPPDITGLQVLMGIHEKGQLTTWGISVPDYQLIRNQGAHAAQWTLDLGARVPCDRLSITISDASFYRPFEVENFDDPQNPRLLANGYLSRRAGEEPKPLVITFDEEEQVRKLRLQITDYSNPTLTIEAIEAGAPARELVFELKQPQRLPLRLFFGNSKVSEPHYDFEKELSGKLKSTPIQASVGEVTKNPAYVPEPLPFTERVPWLIYLVLAAASVALGWILFSLARKTLKVAEVNQS
ncbi:MAG TPA: DUF3999 family protein [Pyrinomonadaceae bacterium]|nr:DUF3999 family protein [Pyrinomonadaceae bacterium]